MVQRYWWSFLSHPNAAPLMSDPLFVCQVKSYPVSPLTRSLSGTHQSKPFTVICKMCKERGRKGETSQRSPESWHVAEKIHFLNLGSIWRWNGVSNCTRWHFYIRLHRFYLSELHGGCHWDSCDVYCPCLNSTAPHVSHVRWKCGRNAGKVALISGRCGRI